jgi:hypothetical protein
MKKKRFISSVVVAVGVVAPGARILASPTLPRRCTSPLDGFRALVGFLSRFANRPAAAMPRSFSACCRTASIFRCPSASKEYIYSGSALRAKIAGGATQYYHSDHPSVRLTTDIERECFG